MSNNSPDDRSQSLAEAVARMPGGRGSRGDLISALNLTQAPSTVYRWLNRAVEKGLLTRSGTTNDSIYVATAEARRRVILEHLSLPLERRPATAYDQGRVMDYVPNETFLLSQEDRERLHDRCAPGQASLKCFSTKEVGEFLAQFCNSSSRLEGRAFELADTNAMLDTMDSLPAGATQVDRVMLLNHRQAAKMILEEIRETGTFPLTPTNLRQVQACLMHQLGPYSTDQGRLKLGHFRTVAVQMSQCAYTPLKQGDAIAAMMSQILHKAELIRDPYEASFFLLLHVSYLQAFLDGNKRLARIVANIPLLNASVTPISWISASSPDEVQNYRNAMVAFYELGDPLLMREQYVNNFMRSAEQFDVLRNIQAPNDYSVLYPQESKLYIQAFVQKLRTCITADPDLMPATVQPADVAGFLAYCHGELEALRENNLMGWRWGIQSPFMRRWLENLPDGPIPHAHPHEESPERESMR